MAVCLASNMTVPELLPISDFRQRQTEILLQLQKAPVVLTQRGRAAVVMVNPAQWNAFMNELEDLHDSVCAAEALEEYNENPDDVVTLDELEDDLKAEGLLE